MKQFENIRYKNYIIYQWYDTFRAIERGSSCFDFTAKTIKEIKAKIDEAENYDWND